MVCLIFMRAWLGRKSQGPGLSGGRPWARVPGQGPVSLLDSLWASKAKPKPFWAGEILNFQKLAGSKLPETGKGLKFRNWRGSQFSKTVEVLKFLQLARFSVFSNW